MSKKLFGTDGVRGKANVFPMDSETVLKLGRAAAHVLRRSEGRHRILIGKDTRISGYMLEQALASGICSMGVDVILCGPLPTPGVAYLTKSMRVDAGVMISASHNSYEDNGIKFFGPDGFKLPDSTEAEIERLLEPGHLDELRASPDVIGKATRIEDAVGRYLVYLRSALERQLDFEGLKIVVDTANGAAYRVAPQLLKELGAEVITLSDRPDGKNINLDCGSLHPENLSKKVVEVGAHCGFALDGDADRVVFVDEKGAVLDGDSILAMLAKSFKARGILQGDGIVATTMSNFGLEAFLQSQGLKLYRSDVGDRYVLLEMLKRGINLGGEQSGHVISLDHNTTGDGTLTALLVISAMLSEKKPLSSVQTLITRYPQKLESFLVSSKPPLESLKKVQETIQAAEKKLSGKGRILIRYSGTEYKARVMVECEDTALCDQLTKELVGAIKAEIGA
jgi:phosphoglucosamine mutase